MMGIMKSERYSSQINIDDRTLIKIALLSPVERKLMNKCPSRKCIVDLVNNQLDEDSYNSILEHMISCDSCYELWIETYFFRKKQL